MDFVQVLLIAGMCVGFILVLVSFGGKKNEEEEPPETHRSFPQNPALNPEPAADVLNKSISEADEVIAELDGISQTALKEMDQKYNELLFLYNLIEEKKGEITAEPKAADEIGADSGIPGRRRPTAGGHPEYSGYYNEKESAEFVELKPVDPRAARIIALKERGKSLPEIAKELGMGQGEVLLIMNLMKES